MKKFLIYLIILVVTISMSGLVYLLLRDDEVLNADITVTYLNEGETFDFSYQVKNKKSSTEITITSSDSTILTVSGETITAEKAGSAFVTVTLKNAKNKTKSLRKLIYVGDGTSELTPFYIRNEIDLKRIGNVEHGFEFNKHYRQTNDIELLTLVNNESGRTFSTIAGTFTGTYNGYGYSINGYKVSGTKTTTSLFETIGTNGKVGFLYVNNVNISGSFDYASVIAKTNHGLVDYVFVSGLINNSSRTGVVAGIACENETTGANKATIQRCVNKAQLKTAGYLAGGIVAHNQAIVTACQNGFNLSTEDEFIGQIQFTSATNTDATPLSGVIAGGIVGKNTNNGVADTQVSNSYSSGQIILPETVLYTNQHIGGVVGVDLNGLFTPEDEKDILQTDITDKHTTYIFGNYFLKWDNNVSRGIGNVTNTSKGRGEEGVTYTAIPISNEDLIGSTLVSYIITYEGSAEQKFEKWPSLVWDFSKEYPQLLSMTDASFSLKNIDIYLPVLQAVTLAEQIKTASEFIAKATNGDFTNINNPIKTYYIMNVLDFSAISTFVMAGTEATPVVVNFTGNDETTAIFKDLKIVSNNAFAGLFGWVENVTFKDISLQNITVEAGGHAEYAGGFAGVTKNSTFDNCKIISTTGSIISTGNKTKAIGGIAGLALKSRIINSSVHAIVTYNPNTPSNSSIYMGGLVGILGSEDKTNANGISFGNAHSSHITDADSYITNSLFKGSVEGDRLQEITAGGAVGLIRDGSVVNNTTVADATITSQTSGGVAGISKGIIEFSSSRVTLDSTYAGGFACYLEGANARIYNSYANSNFKYSGASANAGIVVDMEVGTLIQSCYTVNNFTNGGTSTSNFAKTRYAVKFKFTGNEREYVSKYDGKEAWLIDCFYRNMVNDKDSNDATKTTFFTQTGYSGLYVFGVNISGNLVDTFSWGGSIVNSSLGTGRVQSGGKLVTMPSKLANYAATGFSDAFWWNTSSGKTASGELSLKSNKF